MLADDMVAEEFRRLRSGVCDERFLFGQFQFECFSQEVSETLLNFLRFLLGTTETKQPVVRISHVVESAVAWVLRVLARQFTPLLSQLTKCLPISPPLGTVDGVLDLLVGRVWFPAFSPVVLWHQNRLDELVQFVQVDITEYRATHSALWCSTQRFMPAPFLKISRLQHGLHESQEAVIVDGFSENVEEDRVVEPPETV